MNMFEMHAQYSNCRIHIVLVDRVIKRYGGVDLIDMEVFEY